MVLVIESTPSVMPVAPAPVLAANLGAPAPEPLRPAAEPALPRDEVEAYLVRGERMLKDGDVATARLFFARAAEAGEARGALGMARSFDHTELRKLTVLGLRPNPEEAARWYAKAQDLGLTAAAQ
jgi:TPR repeat protein